MENRIELKKEDSPLDIGESFCYNKIASSWSWDFEWTKGLITCGNNRGNIRMKIDRILGIIIYLMNHDNVSASYLAERFHVSVQTIQRDMISISAIGVPVYSESGINGGYSILPTYKIKNLKIFFIRFCISRGWVSFIKMFRHHRKFGRNERDFAIWGM